MPVGYLPVGDALPNEDQSLLELLTQSIVDGKIAVEDARMIVKRREYYRTHPIIIQRPMNCRELEHIENDMILRAIHRHRTLTAASVALGMSKSTLGRKLRKLKWKY